MISIICGMDKRSPSVTLPGGGGCSLTLMAVSDQVFFGQQFVTYLTNLAFNCVISQYNSLGLMGCWDDGKRPAPISAMSPEFWWYRENIEESKN